VFYIWAGMFAPAGVPAGTMNVLRGAVKTAVEDADFKNAMAKLQTPINYMDAPAFQKFFDQDAKALSAAIRRIGRIGQ